MMRGFIWTPKREQLLRELRRARLTLAELATALGCDVAHVRARLALGGIDGKAPPPSIDLTIVPRPEPRPVPRSPSRRPLIDLSTAPSLMEQRFSKGRR